MSLKEYVKKRNFKKTAEPKGGKPSGKAGHRFVIQKHAASRLHYDFRLELDGTLKSWAVPKGIPFTKGERRLAVRVEDHPVSYIDFEGTIPEGQYGGGTVMVWDRGTFTPLTDSPMMDLSRGKLHFVLNGEKLRGEWYLVRLRGGEEWLLIKGGEGMKPLSAKADDTSVLSGKTMEAIGRAEGRVWGSKPNGKKSKAKVAAIADDPPARTRRASEQRGKSAANAPARTTTGTTRTRPLRAKPTRRTNSEMPTFFEPMKALLVESPPPGSYLYEIKFDGFRAVAFRDRNGTRLLSRNEKDFADRFPQVVKAVDGLDVEEVILDGEIVALDDRGRSSFQLLQAYNIGEKRPPILYYAFDLLWLNGRDFRNEPLSVRQAELKGWLDDRSGVIRFSDTLGSDADVLLKQARTLGLEGLIGKQPDSSYEPGKRSGSWIKLKIHQEQEFVIGGYTPPGGSRPHFGALLVGVYEGKKLKFAGKVGTGFNTKLLASLHAQFKKLAATDCPFVDLPEERLARHSTRVTAAEMKRCHWIKPELVCQLKFTEWTRDDRLRHPVFLGLREDKSAREVVREQKA